jgi:hypothetical protein
MSSTGFDLDSIVDAAGSLAGLSDAELCAAVKQVEHDARLLEAASVRLAGEVAERSRRELGAASLARNHGAQSACQLIERLGRVSGLEAARRIRLAADTRPRNRSTSTSSSGTRNA